MNKEEKLFELGVDGGSVAIFKYFDIKGNDWYFHRTQEMSYEDFNINGIDRKNKQTSASFPEAIIRLLNEYPDSLSYYPVFISEEVASVVIEVIKACPKDIDNSKERWLELLSITEDDLKKTLY